MSKVKEVGRQVLISWALQHEFVEDRWGNLKRSTTNGGVERIKLNPNKARWERKTLGGWVRRASGTYKDFSVDGEGELSGMKKGF